MNTPESYNIYNVNLCHILLFYSCTNTKLNFRPYVVFGKRRACAGGAGAELPATPSVTCGEQSWVHTVSTHLLERRHEVREGFLYFISDLIALKTWQYHKELLSQSSRVWPSMIVTFKKIMTIQSHDMTILMMDVWDGHTHLGDRKCGGIFGLNWPPLWLLFSILFSS